MNRLYSPQSLDTTSEAATCEEEVDLTRVTITGWGLNAHFLAEKLGGKVERGAFVGCDVEGCTHAGHYPADYEWRWVAPEGTMEYEVHFEYYPDHDNCRVWWLLYLLPDGRDVLIRLWKDLYRPDRAEIYDPYDLPKWIPEEVRLNLYDMLS